MMLLPNGFRDTIRVPLEAATAPFYADVPGDIPRGLVPRPNFFNRLDFERGSANWTIGKSIGRGS
jgi:hypothetical protein